MENKFALPALSWIMLSLACVAIILYGLSKALNKTDWSDVKKTRVLLRLAVLIVAWITLISTLAWNGFFSDFSKLPPRPALALLVPLPLVLLVAFSRTGTQLLQKIPAHWLVFIQSFRIVVELLLWMAFRKELIPVQMTFEGGNFDIISGILALPAGYLLMKQKGNIKRTGIVYNIVGLLLLLNILVIAVLSMPTPFRYFMNEPSNILVAQFPYILLPGVLVPMAYGFHILSLRQLFTKK